MRILYVASAVEVGAASGGSTHIAEVACGLRALDHEIVVVARPSPARIAGFECGAALRLSPWPKELALLGLPQIARILQTFQPDAVMERFYNFAGAATWLAHRRGVPAVLEVNAPMIDPPGALKSKLDRLALGSMRRWAVRQAKWSRAIVTPLASTVPPEVPRRKIVQLPWGANTERFDPAIRISNRGRLAALSAELGLPPGVPVVIFLGSFRAWHGARDFALAARDLIAQGEDLAFLAVGGGPELAKLRQMAESWHLPPGRLVLAGPQPHESIREYLALADVGVAPFDIEAHAPLATFGFYWSPLKVFEYMAMGLPVVTIDIPPLNQIVRQEREGILYAPGDPAGLRDAIRLLSHDVSLRDRFGRAARDRVVAHYSWQAHCRALDRVLRKITGVG